MESLSAGFLMEIELEFNLLKTNRHSTRSRIPGGVDQRRAAIFLLQKLLSMRMREFLVVTALEEKHKGKHKGHTPRHNTNKIPPKKPEAEEEEEEEGDDNYQRGNSTSREGEKNSQQVGGDEEQSPPSYSPHSRKVDSSSNKVVESRKNKKASRKPLKTSRSSSKMKQKGIDIEESDGVLGEVRRLWILNRVARQAILQAQSTAPRRIMLTLII